MKRVTASAVALLSGFAVQSASAQTINTVGSDTLGPIMDGLTGCNIGTAGDTPTGAGYAFGQTGGYNPGGDLWCYIWQGSGNGESAIGNDEQEFGPMSRFLETGKANDGCEYSQVDPDYAGCWRIAVDSIALYGNLDEACDDIDWDGTFDVRAGGTGAVTGTYTLSSWRNVLRLVYGGNSTVSSNLITDKDCGSDVRRTLVADWNLLFQGGCATGDCPDGLKHAWRRDDISGTTAVFLNLLGLPGISNEPFCNGNEQEDEDPIRVACEGTGLSGDTVCGFGPATEPNPAPFFFDPIPVRDAAGHLGTGDLSLVLPMAEPTDPYGAQSGAPFQTSCSAFGSGAAFGFRPWTSDDQRKYGPNCPDGEAPLFGECRFPKAPGTGTALTGFGCIASTGDLPFGTGGFDGRVFNLWTKTDNGLTSRLDRPTDIDQNASFLRVRQRECALVGATPQIACLTENVPCSIGYGGASGIDYDDNGSDNVKGLGLFSAAKGSAAYPVEADAAVYPLARPLYFCQLDDFGATPGSQSALKLEYQEVIYNDVISGGGPHLQTAVTNAGFFPVPAPTKDCCFGTFNATSGLCE